MRELTWKKLPRDRVDVIIKFLVKFSDAYDAYFEKKLGGKNREKN